jgi:hypothetical protein
MEIFGLASGSLFLTYPALKEIARKILCAALNFVFEEYGEKMGNWLQSSGLLGCSCLSTE